MSLFFPSTERLAQSALQVSHVCARTQAPFSRLSAQHSDPAMECNGATPASKPHAAPLRNGDGDGDGDDDDDDDDDDVDVWP